MTVQTAGISILELLQSIQRKMSIAYQADNVFVNTTKHHRYYIVPSTGSALSVTAPNISDMETKLSTATVYNNDHIEWTMPNGGSGITAQYSQTNSSKPVQ